MYHGNIENTNEKSSNNGNLSSENDQVNTTLTDQNSEEIPNVQGEELNLDDPELWNVQNYGDIYSQDFEDL